MQGLAVVSAIACVLDPDSVSARTCSGETPPLGNCPVRVR